MARTTVGRGTDKSPDKSPSLSEEEDLDEPLHSRPDQLERIFSWQLRIQLLLPLLEWDEISPNLQQFQETLVMSEGPQIGWENESES
ncbi:MAG: hypothetical protein GY696_37295 [Gammaproteobacteria bacterium]|nr:hypothetical protein [Gammaproteobacteria bacterium]